MTAPIVRLYVYIDTSVDGFKAFRLMVADWVGVCCPRRLRYFKCKILEFTSLLKGVSKAKQRAYAEDQTDRPTIAKLTYLQHAP